MKKEKVLLIDMLNMYVRNFSAFAVMNDNGQLVSGLYGSLASIRSQIDLHQPDHVFVVWEGEKSSERRRKTLTDYKAGRTFKGLNRKYFEYSMEDERESFARQIMVLKECLDELPIRQLAVKYLEADDVIAYLCKGVLRDEYEKIIVSSDKDYFQLVDDTTTVFRPIKTKQDPKGQFINMDWMMEKEECYPQNYTLIKSLCGDKSDNISGVKGVGEKTVKRDFPFLSNMTQYTVDHIQEHAIEQLDNKQKKYQKYIDNKDLIQQNYNIVQLLDEDMSLRSVDTIIKLVEKYECGFNPPKFRIKLLSEGISPSNIDNWISSYSTVKKGFIK
jgi:DNA polymerase I